LSQQTKRQEVAKRYLLGTLSDQERDQLELEYFSDNAEFDEVEIAEDDLVDDYVRGRLSAADRGQFEKVISSSPRLLKRVEFAKLLSQRTAAATPAPVAIPQRKTWRERFSFHQPASLAFGFGVLLIMLGGLVVFGAWLQVRQRSEAIANREASLEERRRQLEQQAAEKQASNEKWASELRTYETQIKEREQAAQDVIENPSSGLVAQLFLQPGGTRGEGENSEAKLTRNTSQIRFTLDLTDSDSPRYRATILTPDAKVISKPRILTPRKTRSGAFLVFELPAKTLSAGDYQIKVEGLTASGESESRYDYQFRLNRP
jgi:hypothetical protein